MRRRQYDEEFKLEAVRLLESQERPLRDVAEGLGLRAETLRQRQLKVAANPGHPFPSSGRHHGAAEESGSTPEAEILRTENQRPKREHEELKRQLAITKQEREILKKRWQCFQSPASEGPVCSQ